MNWEITGVIAEVIAAFAVVVSLIYVAIQIRDSSNQNAAIRGSTLFDEFNRMQEVFISTPAVVQLFTKMKTNQSLSPEEDTLLEAISNRYLTQWFSVETAQNRNVIDEQIYRSFCDDVKRYVDDYPQMHEKFLEVTNKYSEMRNLLIFAPIFGKEEKHNEADATNKEK